MSETIRLGLLSTASINDEILAGAAASTKVSVHAVASRDLERARAYAAARGIPCAHGSYEALLADPGVDAVYVSLPNGLHHEWTLRALEAGKHVLCEKPYSRHSEEVAAAFGVAAARSLVLAEAFMYRHHPQTQEIARLVRDGAIGTLLALRATFSFRLLDLSDIRALPELDGGALLDIGCYCVSGARLIAGEPLRVHATAIRGSTGVDTAFYGTMEHPGEVVSQFEASFLAPRRQQLEIVGTGGTLTAHAPWRTDWEGDLVLDRDGVLTVIETADANAYQLELDGFADAIAGRAPPLLGRDDALGQAKALEMLLQAAATGAVVEL